ncbi:MAG: ExbD/TolR family protein [Thermoguttaceae bacterium]
MRKHRSNEEVTLNVTAMLDMAFQLLAFFILTFRPPPGEAQIFLKLPPAQPVAGFTGSQPAGADDTKKPEDVKTTKSLTVTLLDRDSTGSISDVQVGIPSVSMKPIPFNDLESELKVYFRAKDENEAGGQKGAQGDYEQVVINASPTLRWDEVMKVMELCTKFTTVKGDKLPAVSLLAAGEDPGG